MSPRRSNSHIPFAVAIGAYLLCFSLILIGEHLRIFDKAGLFFTAVNGYFLTTVLYVIYRKITLQKLDPGSPFMRSKIMCFLFRTDVMIGIFALMAMINMTFMWQFYPRVWALAATVWGGAVFACVVIGTISLFHFLFTDHEGT